MIAVFAFNRGVVRSFWQHVSGQMCDRGALLAIQHLSLMPAGSRSGGGVRLGVAAAAAFGNTYFNY